MNDSHVTTTISWKKESGFIWSMMGSAIGFANVLSFSAQCYKNGGGAFLIPFVIAVLLLGLPMLFLEGVIGHRLHLPIVAAYDSIAKKPGKFFGWLSICAVITIGGFYTVLTGYSVAYAWFFGTSQIPSDTEAFWLSFLQDSGSLTIWGGFSWTILLFTMLVGVFAWVVLVRNIRAGIERTCSVFLPILLGLILIFAIVVCFLPGAFIGFRHYLTPDFSRLGDGTLWRDVFGQVFFSFSLGLGIVTGYSRHTGAKVSIPKAMCYVALGDFLVSLISGFAVFGCVGYLSSSMGIPFDQLVQSDSSFEMGFVIFPKILQTFGSWFSPIIGVIFFFCLFIAGVTGLFSIIESITGNLEVEFGQKRKVAASLASGAVLLLAIPFCFGNGQQIMGALTPMVLGDNMLLGGIAEVVVFVYLSRAIRNDPMWFHGGRRTMAFHLLQFVVPVLLTVILGAAILDEIESGFSAPEIVRFGWFIGACGIALLLTYHKPKFDSVTIKE